MNVCLLFVDLKYWKKCDNLTFINQEWLFYVQESQKEITLGQFIWSLFVLWGIPCASFQWFARSKHLRLSAKSFFYVWPSPLWIKLWGCKLIYQSFKYFSIEERVLVHSRLKCLGGVPVLWSKWPLASSLLQAIKTCH